jgi:hypothetical protein
MRGKIPVNRTSPHLNPLPHGARKYKTNWGPWDDSGRLIWTDVLEIAVIVVIEELL